MRIGSQSCRAVMRVLLAVVVLVSAADVDAAECKTERKGRHTSTTCTSAIGDEACAVMMEIEVETVDTTGAQAPGADVWMVDTVPPYPRENLARRLGLTGQDGRLKVLWCFMGSRDFWLWRPEKDSDVKLLFLVFRDGFGVERVELGPKLADVLAKGNLTGVPPGTESKDWKHTEWRGRAYPVQVHVELKRVAP